MGPVNSAGVPDTCICDAGRRPRIESTNGVEGFCDVVPCPSNSQGSSVVGGCACIDGFTGQVAPSATAPDFYDGGCEQCPSGSVSTGGIAGILLSCSVCSAPGQVNNAQQSFCVTCAPGKAPNADRSGCDACTGHAYSALGIACTECYAEFDVDAGHLSCSPPYSCPVGSECSNPPCTTDSECAACGKSVALDLTTVPLCSTSLGGRVLVVNNSLTVYRHRRSESW